VSAVAALTLGAGVAEAAPTGCKSWSPWSKQGNAHCTGGNGEFRVTITCKWKNNNHVYIVNGNWKRPGNNGWSYATCKGRTDYVTYHAVQKKN
jgi:hypothetical protein